MADEYYIAQERAMAPGISGDWPNVIEPKGLKHARLKRVDGVAEVIAAGREIMAVTMAARYDKDRESAAILRLLRGLAVLDGARSS